MPTATRTEATFRLEYSVRTHILAPPERVWAVLTQIQEWTRWNTTVTSIEGTLALGQRLKLRVPISDRTFTPKVAALEPYQRMTWKDGAAPMFTGVRDYTLSPRPDGTTDFTMTEAFQGLMLPLIKKSLPDFSSPFERFAADLKSEAERT